MPPGVSLRFDECLFSNSLKAPRTLRWCLPGAYSPVTPWIRPSDPVEDRIQWQFSIRVALFAALDKLLGLARVRFVDQDNDLFFWREVEVIADHGLKFYPET